MANALRSSVTRFSTRAEAKPMVDTIIIGAGAVGLATARAIGSQLSGRSTFVVEKARTFGEGTSSRSSEVVHAGIYYKKDSLRALWCVQGRRALKKYCAERGIEYVERGKLIVATSDEQVSKLGDIENHARTNGVGDFPYERLVFMDSEQAQRLEPALECKAALLSPSTAVVNSHQYMQSLEQDALDYGVNFVYGSKVLGGRLVQNCSSPTESLFEVELQDENGQIDAITCSNLINCAGLYAPNVAQSIVTGSTRHDDNLPDAYYCKGSYFKLQGVSNPFERLIYPVPQAHGLGVHLTIDVQGNAKFGPDIEFIDKFDEKTSYQVDPSRSDKFYSLVREYYPDLPDEALVPDYAGVRPKLGPEEQPALDFQVYDQHVHGIPGLIHCLGFESPGLTSSLATGASLASRV